MKDNSRKLKIETCIRCPNLYYLEKDGAKTPKCYLSDRELGFGNIEDENRLKRDYSATIPDWCKLKPYNN